MEEIIYKLNKDIDKEMNRRGKCNPNKCKAACCRFVHLGRTHSRQQEKYVKGFGIKVISFLGARHMILEKPCKFLDLKTYKCKRHKTKPACCRQFPTPDDLVYEIVSKKCSYQFKDKKVEKMEL